MSNVFFGETGPIRTPDPADSGPEEGQYAATRQAANHAVSHGADHAVSRATEFADRSSSVGSQPAGSQRALERTPA